MLATIAGGAAAMAIAARLALWVVIVRLLS